MNYKKSHFSVIFFVARDLEPVLLRPEWTLSEDEVEIEGNLSKGPSGLLSPPAHPSLFTSQ